MDQSGQGENHPGEGEARDDPPDLFMIVILRDRPAVGFLPESPSNGFQLGESPFHRTRVGNFISFYDTLVNFEGEFAGLNFCGSDLELHLVSASSPQTAEYFREFFDHLQTLDYVDNDRGFLKVVLKGDIRPQRVESNGEQAFGETVVYRSDSGEFAISCDTYSLIFDVHSNALDGTDLVEIVPMA